MLSSTDEVMLNKKCIDKLFEEFDEDFLLNYDCKSEKDFIEYFNLGVDFYQIRFTIKFPGKVEMLKIDKNISIEDGKLLLSKIETINKKLSEIQKNIADSEEYESDKSSYFYFVRVGTDLGLCSKRSYIRNRISEEEEERKEYEEHLNKMKSDKNYRDQYNWMNEKYRPYGGAFDSIEEYYNYIR